MLHMLGGIGVGLVAGWAAGRLIYRAPWNVVVWVLLGVLAQGLIVLRLTALPVLIGYAAALGIGALACVTWVRSLEARYGRMQ
jgi:F0F1-type ATP synthase assembly protein I